LLQSTIHPDGVDSPSTPQETKMNTFTKLAVAALGAASIAGGVALAQETQSTNSSKDPNADPATANYGTPPGAPLKRDGSLHADETPAPMTSPVATDSSSTTTTTTNTTTVNAPASEPAPVAATAPEPAVADTAAAPADTSLQPRADRN
jgi:hypothetical protein